MTVYTTHTYKTDNGYAWFVNQMNGSDTRLIASGERKTLASAKRRASWAKREAVTRDAFEKEVDLRVKDIARLIENSDWGMAELANKALHNLADTMNAEVVTYPTGGFSIYY